MRYLLLASAALGLTVWLAAAPKAVSAAGPEQGFQIVNNNYNYNFNYQDGGRYGPPYGRAYAPRYDYGYRPYAGESHDAAVNNQGHPLRFRQHTPRCSTSTPELPDWSGWWVVRPASSSTRHPSTSSGGRARMQEVMRCEAVIWPAGFCADRWALARYRIGPSIIGHRPGRFGNRPR